MDFLLPKPIAILLRGACGLGGRFTSCGGHAPAYRGGENGTTHYDVALAIHDPTTPLAPPWPVEDIGAAFVVKDSTEQKLAYVYCEEEPGQRSAAKLLHQG